MPVATELVSLLEARERVKAGEDQLERLQQVVDAALDFCGKEIGEPVLSEQYVEVHDGSGLTELTLRRAPITEVSLVQIIRTVAPVAWDEVTAASYPVEIVTPGRRRIAFRNRVFDCGIRNWQVTYRAGYGDADDVAPIPDLLHEVCLQAVENLWHAPERQAAGIASITIGGPNVSTTTYLNEVMSAQSLDFLRKFRKVRFR